MVIQGLGGGHLPRGAANEAKAIAANGQIVVLTSRVGRGEGLQKTYGFVGSETDLISHGVLSAGWLPGPKARIVVELLLANSSAARATERIRDYLKELTENS